MKYGLVLTFNVNDPEKVFRIFALEAGKKDRSEIKIEKGKDKIIFKVKSKDSVALKASANLIIKILTIYEKTLEMVKNG
jgi:tRNA threonylcarbamoyladenosine modification (KEOPS) complex  Pcc1 subunit